LNFDLNICHFVVGHFLKLLFLRPDCWVDVEGVFNDVSIGTMQVAGRPCKYILILAKELKQLFFFLWLQGCVYDYQLVWQVLI